MAAVSGQQSSAVAGDDARNQAVGHPDGMTRAFEESANLTGGKVLIAPRRGNISPASASPFTGEVIDEDVRIGDRHRQFPHRFRV
jgi:hypothetical protein